MVRCKSPTFKHLSLLGLRFQNSALFTPLLLPPLQSSPHPNAPALAKQISLKQLIQCLTLYYLSKWFPINKLSFWFSTMAIFGQAYISCTLYFFKPNSSSLHSSIWLHDTIFFFWFCVVYCYLKNVIKM